MAPHPHTKAAGGAALHTGPQETPATLEPGRALQDVDSSPDPETLARYLLETTWTRENRQRAERRARLAAIATGEQVLDVGCGVGSDLDLLAQIVGPSGRVVGVDASASLIESARSRTASAQPSITVLVHDAHGLPFAPASFDVCWANRVLAHVASPGGVLREMRRVLRDGGRVVLAEVDYAGILLDTDEVEVTDRVLGRCSASFLHPRLGRVLRRRCKGAGFVGVSLDAELLTVEGLAAIEQAIGLRAALTGLVRDGELSPAAAAAWWQAMQEADSAAHGLVLAAPLSVAVGTATFGDG
jgi:ubiquinone/menaquinone biosynthesis C-methylase UbiE